MIKVVVLLRCPTRRGCPISGSTACAWSPARPRTRAASPALDRAWSSAVGKIALAHSRESHSDRLVLITEEHAFIG